MAFKLERENHIKKMAALPAEFKARKIWVQHTAVEVFVFFRVDMSEVPRCTLDCRPKTAERPARMRKYGQDFVQHHTRRDEPVVAVDLLAANANARIRLPIKIAIRSEFSPAFAIIGGRIDKAEFWGQSEEGPTAIE